jgi:hypothetical protein
LGWWLWIGTTVCLADDAAKPGEKPQIVSVKRIWNEGQHNAFTDLIRFQDRWFCTFREAEGHVGGDGRLRVLVSRDGETWESAALLSEEGIDLRDPKLSITPEGKLMIVAGGSVYQGTKVLKGRQPRVAFSADGRQWTSTQRVLGEGDWLWRVTWHQGTCYGVSYHPVTPGQATDSPAAAWTLTLVSSPNGIDFKPITKLEVPGRANETTLRFLANGEMMSLVRREEGNTLGWIGTSRPPYRDWQWSETKMRLGGPNFIQLADGSLWAATRHYGGQLADGTPVPKASTVLCSMTADSLTPVLLLPSSGDTSYAGLVWHEGLLWMSYYSSHEGKSSIYLAKIRLPGPG